MSANGYTHGRSLPLVLLDDTQDSTCAPTSKRPAPTSKHGRRNGVTVSFRDVNEADREAAREALRSAEGYDRPIERGDCLSGGENAERPCPFVSCKFHLYLDVNPRNGSIRFNFPGLYPWELPSSCALDVVDVLKSGATEAAIAERLNLTRQAVSQLLARTIAKLKATPCSEVDDDEGI